MDNYLSMKSYKLDLHLHSQYAFRTSKGLKIDAMLEWAKNMELDVIGSGDILHTGWRKQITPYIESSDCAILLTTEVSIHGVHYLLIFKDLLVVEKVYEQLKPKSKDIDNNGRCNLNITYEELLALKKYPILVGLAHAFGPKGYVRAYNKLPTEVDFIQVGLDFELEYVYRLDTAVSLTTSSDAHSIKNIGRAYLEFPVKPSYQYLKTLFTNKSSAYTLVSEPAGLGRWYASGRVKGVDELANLYLGTKNTNKLYSCRLEVTPYRLFGALGLKFTTKTELTNYYRAVYNKYKDGTKFKTEYGRDGIPGKLTREFKTI